MRSASETDDDIQFLYRKAPEAIPCGICSEDLTAQTVEGRQAHYEAHFESVPPKGNAQSGPSASRALATLSSPRTGLTSVFKRKGKGHDSHNVFWHPSRSDPPPSNFTPGLIPLLKRSLIRSHDRGDTQRACLCFEGATHIQAEAWDRGWGCGYRNFLMACAALMEQTCQPVYFPLLDTPTPPGVHNLQQWIEDAWENGFDTEGAKQLKHTLVDTNKWIGTAEIFVAFTTRGIPSRLVDFDLENRGVDTLIDWIVAYFTEGTQPKRTTVNDALRGATPVAVTDKMPLILQHAGHSRTVIGYEKCRNGSINLLMFDPSKSVPQDIRQNGLLSISSTRSQGRASKPPQRTMSPSKLFQQVFYPGKNTNKKRKAPESPGMHTSLAKRVRAGGTDDVIIIDDDGPEPCMLDGEGSSSRSHDLDPARVLKFFRVKSDSLGKKDKYQILYFPLAEPWDEAERLARRVVTSIKVC